MFNNIDRLTQYLIQHIIDKFRILENVTIGCKTIVSYIGGVSWILIYTPFVLRESEFFICDWGTVQLCKKKLTNFISILVVNQISSS